MGHSPLAVSLRVPQLEQPSLPLARACIFALLEMLEVRLQLYVVPVLVALGVLGIGWVRSASLYLMCLSVVLQEGFLPVLETA